MRFAELEAVLAVDRLKSFRAAATELGISPTALGKTVATLEQRLGVRLFNRTTRSVATTSAGRSLVADLTPALAAVDSALANARAHREELAGSLRINTSLHGARYVLPLALEFLKRHPSVSVELATERRMIDIVREGYDAGVRTRDSVPKDMVRVPLGGVIAFAIVATPGYFRAHGTPTHVRDLADHRCLRYRTPTGGEYRWELVSGRRNVTISVDGPLVLDQLDLGLEAVRAGVGLAFMPRWIVEPDLARGRLVQVLREATPDSAPLCLYYPVGRNPPPVLRAFTAQIRRVRDQG